MRIRSIKPEFWRSDDITQLSREVRLLFIGLWSYVDDNGVGRDDFRSIAADLFALEDDQKEVRDFIREGLATLSRALLVSRYEVDGKRFIYINTWDRHQRVDRPNRQRYPRPGDNGTPPTSGNAEVRDTLATPSRKNRETPSTGAVEQGNRGTGEQGNRGSAPRGAHAAAAAEIAPAEPDDQPPAHTAAAPAASAARELVAEWVGSCTKRPPSDTIGQTGRKIRGLLDDGIDPDDIRAGLALWTTKGLSPSVLPSVVNEVMNAQPAQLRLVPGGGAVNGRIPTTTARVQAVLAHLDPEEP